MSAASALDLEGLDAAVALVRASSLAPWKDGELSLRLRERLALDDEGLAQALQALHGVATLSPAEWARCVVRQQVPGSGWLVGSGPRTYLLSQDPWAPGAVQALARGGHGAWQLALARPGQEPRPAATATAAPAPVSDVPTVRFVDDAIAGAWRDGASDIHFESDRQGLALKYRLDGVMNPATRLQGTQAAEEAISRIKVLAQLDITERRRPQDGRFRWTGAAGASVDMRVSVMPSIFGEDAVLRLLDKAQLRSTGQDMNLAALGFEGGTAARLRALASRPHGMLLMTGPTGSGKTTTVYAALTEVNDGLEKIITIEDPVEYELPGVLQIPVNEQKGLTFATGLRSILRHDPDKILVGEIRDSETAEIAVQSALTGHLVFTTVHANSLADVLGRFQHFGVDPFALASALNGVVVQRLLRKLCPHCMGWRELRESDTVVLRRLELPAPERLPVAVGCTQCRQTGYRGRFVIAEVHDIDDALKDLILRRASMSELKALAGAQPGQRLLAVALAQVAPGTTSLEEVERVVGLA